MKDDLERETSVETSPKFQPKFQSLNFSCETSLPYMWVIEATPEKSKEHPNLRILPFPKKWQDAVWIVRYAGGIKYSVTVSLKLRSLRIHPPRLFEVLSIQTNFLSLSLSYMGRSD